MALKDLEGKRTGRPPGSKSTVPWRRDVRWVYQHLHRPDAEPPSELSKLLLALAREYPDRFIACLVALEAASPKRDTARRETEFILLNDGDWTDGVILEDGLPCRVQEVFVTATELLAYLRGYRGSWVADLPSDASVVGYKVDPLRKGIFLIVRSDSFPEWAKEEPIPTLTGRWITR